jgi:hypothetical protein
VPRPLVQRLHTLFSTARLTRSSLFLDSIDEWNEQKHSQCVCVCVCVHLSVEGIACTFFKTIVSLHKPPTFWGETNHFSVFFFFFSEMKYHRCEVVYLFIYKCKRTKSCVSLKKIASLEKVKNKKNKIRLKPKKTENVFRVWFRWVGGGGRLVALLVVVV